MLTLLIELPEGFFFVDIALVSRENLGRPQSERFGPEKRHGLASITGALGCPVVENAVRPLHHTSFLGMVLRGPCRVET